MRDTTKRDKVAHIFFEVDWNLKESQLAGNIWSALINNGVIEQASKVQSEVETELLDSKALAIISQFVRADRDSAKVKVRKEVS